MSHPDPDTSATPPEAPGTDQAQAPAPSSPDAEEAAPPPRAPTPVLHHPALYGALGLWLLLAWWLFPPPPPEQSPNRPEKPRHGLLESVLGDGDELDLRKALVIFPPLIVGCGLLIGYIVLRSYDIRVFPRCDFPAVPWTAWHLLRCGVLFLVVQRVLLFGMVGLAHMKVSRGWLARVPSVIVQVLESNVLMAVICGLVIALVAAGGTKPLAALGLRERWPVRRAALGGVAYVMTIPLSFLAGILTYLVAWMFRLQLQPQPVLMDAQSLSSSAFLVFAFSAVVVAPATEEFLFRGFLYGTLRRYLGPMGAICLSAAAFAAAHAFASGFLPLFVIGFLLAYLYERTGSLAASIAAHALHNFYGLLLLRLLHPPGFL